MLIGVVSDTHMPHKAKALPKALIEGLTGTELIIHAGDWTSPDVIAMLERFAPVESVAGNNDGTDIVRRFGRKRIVEAGGKRIGIVHGDGYGRSTPDNAFQAFAGQHVDAIVFGHSHVPYKDVRDGILMFNPGSPTDKRFQQKYSFGLLRVGARIEAKHIYFARKD
ncbi:metallophosphoesterase family protein [Paenibacillus sp. MSJ-34]|uniref:metallophosphoesterase family protein n=1 Tax=Paenibacillus sp. MSJ-34 TaxID=2841529 RepID=UPI001C109157|nr:metallophosphoesterase [Paenibacillus sp. MSJ-34]MBU5442834.1 metallophosphoesterase [Paenibacillus sp. MSJ-34]